MKGIIFIPDITGFTDFVKNTDIVIGASVIRELISEIIKNTPLGFYVSEIEGDAVLFYKMGQPLQLEKLFAAFERMEKAFYSKYEVLSTQYNIVGKLSLKLIVHYGNVSIYRINDFIKLYGQTIIESHHLLKNGNGHTEYILITEDYLKALRSPALTSVSNWNCVSFGSQPSFNTKHIDYYFFKNKNKEIKRKVSMNKLVSTRTQPVFEGM